MKSPAQALVDAWNRSDLDGTIELFADDAVVVSMHPKGGADRPLVEVHGKVALREAMLGAPTVLPRFELLSAMERGNHFSLLMRDGDGDQLTVAIDLNDGGLIVKLVSLRAP